MSDEDQAMALICAWRGVAGNSAVRGVTARSTEGD